MSNKKVIGLSGVARAGKDTFAAILEMKLQQAGKSVKKVSLAGPLKQQCDSFLTSNLGISAFTQVTEEKNIMRPFLVWYGDAQRKRTDGRNWIEHANKEIQESNYDYYIVTDIRYDAYEKDELYFLKNEVNGILCHISKFTMLGNPFQPDHKLFVQPANEHEALNDPKIRIAAHHRVQWRDVGKMSATELLHDPELTEHVDEFMIKYVNQR
jgi:hypothetical protein